MKNSLAKAQELNLTKSTGVDRKVILKEGKRQWWH
jgi:hypothetical protein